MNIQEKQQLQHQLKGLVDRLTTLEERLSGLEDSLSGQNPSTTDTGSTRQVLARKKSK